MLYYALKVGISAAVIVAVTEIAKRSSIFAALLAALPLTSLLTFLWMYYEGEELTRIADLSGQIFWLVLPSLVLFLLLPLLLRQGFGFWLSLALAITPTVAGYFAMVFLLRKFGMQL